MNERISLAFMALFLAIGSLIGAWWELKKGKDRILGRRTVAAIGTLVSLQWCYVGIFIASIPKFYYERLDIKYIVSNLVFPIGFLIPVLPVFIIDGIIYQVFVKGKNNGQKRYKV
jgi:membrane protease YdiL (CAAX protease family)